ncbi:hypothetical protein DL765_007048 [Monosporascus sp. GIB2]|nr:hypothetical protein DL765_007048 [Monosporascus sp. GIB2]
MAQDFQHRRSTLPEALESTYERYKHDTAVVSSWLVQTAKRYGYPTPLEVIGGQPKAKSARLKGKARKQMNKEAGGGVNTATSGKRRYEYILAVKDFVPLAEFIATVNEPKPVPIPLTIMTTLSRVIRVRKSFSTLLEKEGSALDVDSDVKHSYFVGILENVRDILKPLVGALDLSEMHETVPETSMNPFSELEVYEPSEAFLNAPDVDITMPDYAPEPEDTMEDAYFAFCALFQDALSLRSRISRLWNGYESGAMYLAAVSVAANTTTSLVRQMEEDIAPLINKHGGFLQFIHAYFAVTCRGQGKDYKKRERPSDDINLDTYDIADHCMFNAWQCLDAFRRAHSPGRFQVYNGQFGEYNQSLDSAQLSNRMKYQQDKAALLEILGDITVVALVFKANPCEDEFTRGVRLMLNAGEVPFWVASAAQIFLDTLRCLQGPNALRPFEEMRVWNSTIAGSVNTVMTFHSETKLRIKNWPPSNDAILKQLISVCNFWANDPISALKQRRSMPFKPFLFLHRHAMFCGLWIRYVRATFQESGTIFTMAWGATLYTGHLYHAMRREALLGAARWDDMELLLALQGADAFFVGGPPSDVERDFKNYCLCMGYSAANWVPPSRQKKGRRSPLASTTGPRSLKTQAEVSMRFMQLLGTEQGGGMTTEDVKLILAASQWTETQEGDQIVMEKESSMTNPSASSKTIGKRKEEPRKEATPAEFVLKLALALQAEVAEMSFDYFSMHITCWSMLESIRKALDGKLRELFAPDYLDDASQLPFVVGYIFMAAARKEVWPGVEPLDLMQMAVPPVMRVIERQGHSIRDELEKVGIVHVIEEDDDNGERG